METIMTITFVTLVSTAIILAGGMIMGTVVRIYKKL